MKIKNTELIREPTHEYPIAVNKVSVALYKIIIEEYEYNIKPLLKNRDYQQLINHTLYSNQIQLDHNVPKTELVLKKTYGNYDIQFKIKEFEYDC